MRDVTYLRVIAGDQSRIIDYSHVVKKVDDRYQSLRCQKKPGEFERSHEHDTSRNAEDRGRRSHYPSGRGHEGEAEYESHKTAYQKDQQIPARTNAVLQCAAEDE